MALYSYKCREDGCEERTVVHHPIPAPGQDMPRPVCLRHVLPHQMVRDYRTDKPQPAPVWQEHYNPAAGRNISDRRQLADTFKRNDEAAFLSTGIEQRTVVRDAADMAPSNDTGS